jgi:hypothetical protein
MEKTPAIWVLSQRAVISGGELERPLVPADSEATPLAQGRSIALSPATLLSLQVEVGLTGHDMVRTVGGFHRPSAWLPWSVRQSKQWS